MLPTSDEMAKTKKPYVVELDGKRYIGFPREDSWKLYEAGIGTDKSKSKITHREPKILGRTYFITL